MVTAAQRATLAHLMDTLVQRRAQVHYPFHDQRTEQIHGIATVGDLQHALSSEGGLTMDCSQSVELLCHVAGLENPNGGDYQRIDGWTKTLLDNPRMHHYYDPGGANVGALVVFGPYPGEHVCMVRHPGHDPILFSHGQEAGPFFLPLSQERQFHHPPVTFLAITKL